MPYLQWSVDEVDKNQGAHPELVRLANYARQRLEQTNYLTAINSNPYDPEMNATVPPPPSVGSGQSSWGMVSVEDRREIQRPVLRVRSVPQTTAKSQPRPKTRPHPDNEDAMSVRTEGSRNEIMAEMAELQARMVQLQRRVEEGDL